MWQNQNVSLSFLVNGTCFYDSANFPICVSTVILSSFNVFVNAIFLVLLFMSRRHISWKRYAHITNLTVSDLFVNCLFVGHLLFRRSLVTKFILHKLLGLGMRVNSFSYFASIFIQYYAVKQPLQYRTVVNMYKIKLSIGLIWCFTLIYVAVSVVTTYYSSSYLILSISDLLLQGIFAFLNTILYVYVVYISNNQKRLKMRSVKTGKWSADVGIRKNLPPEYQLIISETRSFMKGYKFLITVGLGLIIYWLTALPLWFYWIIVEVSNRRIYFILTQTKQYVILIWISRCFFDPLLYIYREPKLIQNIKRLLLS